MLLTSDEFFDLSNWPFMELFDFQGYPWQALTQIESFLKKQKLGRIEGKISDGSYLINPELISIGEGAVVEAGAYIQGPCLIGKNCAIRHGAYIRGNVITGDGCVIGHCSEVKNSLFLNNAHAAHFAYVGDSILGNNVNLGAGTKCANLRLDGKQIFISFNKERIPTGLRKFGAIIGDSVQLGCNSVTNPGTLIGKNSSSLPCTNFGGVIPPDSCVKGASVTIEKK